MSVAAADPEILTPNVSNPIRRRPQKSYPLQYLRAVAAVSVVLFHASHYMAVWRQNDSLYKVFNDNFGLFGVTLFFVTSGALMSLLAGSSQPYRFLAHRVLRIYPIYLVVATASVVVTPILASNVVFDPWAFGLVVGGPHAYGLGVEWTLPYEIMFYLVVFGLILAGGGRRADVLGVLWIGLILAVQILAPGFDAGFQFPDLARILLAGSTLPFAAGLLVPRLVGLPWLALVGPIVGGGLLVYAGASGSSQAWLYTTACTALVAAALTPAAIRLPEIPLLTRLGDWSFALYLCHVQTILFILRFAPATGHDGLLWAFVVAVSVGLGCLVGQIDVRLYGTLKRAIDTAPRRVVQGFSSAFVVIYLAAGVAWMLTR